MGHKLGHKLWDKFITFFTALNFITKFKMNINNQIVL